jgi:predicted SnoaL-like aldol condensation-catalyzing enzyme
MSTLTPRRVVELYNDDLWTHKKRELITQLLANPLRRHHPGGTQIFSHEDMVRRYDDYHKKFAKISGVGRHYVCEGSYVTLVWDFRMEEASGAAKTISSIEIFKVVDGKITEVWNPNNVAESYPTGPWPEFTI